ncbi:Oxysterol-binding protein [Giardia muris]|uniref:Oxysterol-binding protein n=1 Tax=Giardia muris TaxID=5742 RepID=A0A4Z1SWT6_GIAMU|nr:Oxysterol-binding protein [Giardia muris]|eukprot:TNJ30272.1 Oxysterol-binding protein [Giardia muris]
MLEESSSSSSEIEVAPLPNVMLTKNGRFFFSDEDVAAAQRQMAHSFMREMGRRLFTGKSIMNQSLPVVPIAWAPMTQSEQLARQLFFNLHLLEEAHDTSGVRRFSACVAYAMSSLYSSITDQRKAFNPMIGEGYEGSFMVTQAQTYRVDVVTEQVRNHPPTSFYTVRIPSICTIYGATVLEANIFMNRVRIVRGGKIRIVFEDGSPRTVEFQVPPFHLSGLLWGKRWGMFLTGFDVFGYHDSRQDLPLKDEQDKQDGQSESIVPCCSCNIYLGKRRDSNNMHGTITGFSEEIEVSGSWAGTLCIGDVEYNLLEKELSVLELKYPVSRYKLDGRMRPDLLHYVVGEIEEANKAKKALEERQRNDRTLRSE